MKILLVIFIAVIAAIAAGLHFHFNAIPLILLILGCGLYWVTRSGVSPSPKGIFVPWGPGHGIYLSGRDFAPDDDPQAGEDPREGDGFR